MNMFSDEMILYCGLIIASASILLGIIYSVAYTIKKRKLNAKFDIEYGDVRKKK